MGDGFNYETMKQIIATHKHRADIDQQEWDRHRRWYLSEYWDNRKSRDVPARLQQQGDEEDEITLQSNFPYAYVDTMVATVCPSNPRVDVSARKEDLRDAAEARSAIINDVFYRRRFHRSLWALSRRASVFPRSFLKVEWDAAGKTPRFKVLNPHFVWFDVTATEPEDVRYIIEVTVMTKEEFESHVKKPGPGNEAARYKKKVADKASFDKYPTWLEDKERNRSVVQEGAVTVFQWCVVYAFYDFTIDGGRFYHIIEEGDEPLFSGDLPYRFLPNPFYTLIFNDNLTDGGGLSDVKLIGSSLARLNELSTLELQHIQASMPLTLFDKTAVDDPATVETAYQTSSGPGAFIGVDLSNRDKAGLDKVFFTLPMPQTSGNFEQKIESIKGDIQYTMGMPDYMRGVLGGAEVATEVALMDNATRTRVGHRQQEVFDTICWAAKAIISLYEEFLGPDDEVSVRVQHSDNVMPITRETLAARNIETTEDGDEILPDDHVMDFDYEVVAYSPAATNKQLRLESIQKMWPVLAQMSQAGLIDAKGLANELMDLMELRHLRVKAAPQPPGGLPTGAPPDAGAPPPGAGGVPGVMTSAGAPGTEAPPSMAGGPGNDGGGGDPNAGGMPLPSALSGQERGGIS